jgi:lipopolysaccharide export system protein LptA
MKKNLAIIMLLIFTLLSNAIALGQHLQDSSAKVVRKINLQHADLGVFDNIAGKSAQRLIGHVKAEHDGSLLFCDSAYLYGKSNSMDAFGHVHIIVNDSLDLFGDRLFYNGNTKIAEVHDHVRLIDEKATLFSDELIYDRNTGVGKYFVWGRIEDSANVLTSKKGYYYSHISTVFFKDSVVLVNPDYTMTSDTLKYETTTERVFFFGPTTIVGDSSFLYAENGFYDTQNKEARLSENAFVQNKSSTLSGDSIYYNKFSGLAKAFRQVVMADTSNDVLVTGEYGIYNKKEHYAYVVDSAQAIFVDDQDSLFVHADTLMITFDSVEKVQNLLAYHHMKFYRESIQGMADSMVYKFNDSVLYFYKQPMFWFDENQISADEISMFTKNGDLDSAAFYHHVFLVSQDTVDTNYYNQVSGDIMYAWFFDNDLRKIYMKGKSETIYFLWEEDGTPVGMNKMQAKDMLIYLENQQLKTMTYINKPIATLYPYGQIEPSDEKLKNFIWKMSLRPQKREDIFKKDSKDIDK